MAKNRYVDTRFWHDTFIREHLNPLDRYLFLYFLTNDKTNICGIYELPISIISSETGIEVETIKKMLTRFEGKVHYIEGWIYVVNFQKYQNTTNPKIITGIENEKAKIPNKILDEINKLNKDKIGYVYPIYTQSHLNSNSNSNTNMNTGKTKVLQPQEDLDLYIASNYETTTKYNPETNEEYDWFINIKTRGGRSKDGVIKDFNDYIAKQVTTKKATEKREETMSITNKTAVKILKDMQGIANLDGSDNYKHADNVIKKIKEDMIAHNEVVSDNEIEILSPLKILLERIKEKSPFHWKNMTSYSYLDKWFNKIIKEVL